MQSNENMSSSKMYQCIDAEPIHASPQCQLLANDAKLQSEFRELCDRLSFGKYIYYMFYCIHKKKIDIIFQNLFPNKIMMHLNMLCLSVKQHNQHRKNQLPCIRLPFHRVSQNQMHLLTYCRMCRTASKCGFLGFCINWLTTPTA